jgi:hypothetical protein
MWRYASSWVFSGALAALGPSRAFAADPSCSSVAVAVDEGLRARWPELPGRLRQAFKTRTDIDACARVELTLNKGGSLGIGVILPDHRSASRQVSRPEDVVPTLEALLLLPRPAAVAAGVETGVDAPSPPIPASAPTLGVQAAAIPVVPAHVAVPERDELEIRRASHPPGRLRIELSAVTDARIGDGETSLGLGALSLLDIGGWLVGFEGRADRDQQIGGGDAGAAMELTVLGGRRFRVRSLALDFVGGPAVALRAAGTNTTVSPGPGGSTSSQASLGTVPRALVGAHLIFGARSWFRTFVGVEGEFGPASAPGDTPSDEFRLPVWTVGLELGATVGTQ